MGGVSKIEAAKRQIETAIDLYFFEGDFLSIYSISFAAYQVLSDIYRHHRDDGFLEQLADNLPRNFRRHLAKPANFLKHADRDHDAQLTEIDHIQIEAVLCTATVLYKRVTGDLTLKMKGFDYIIEEQAYEEIGVKEVDTNPERIKEHAARREALRKLTGKELLAEKSKMYKEFLRVFPMFEEIWRNMESDGATATDMLDTFDQLTPVNKE